MLLVLGGSGVFCLFGFAVFGTFLKVCLKKFNIAGNHL